MTSRLYALRAHLFRAINWQGAGVKHSWKAVNICCAHGMVNQGASKASGLRMLPMGTLTSTPADTCRCLPHCCGSVNLSETGSGPSSLTAMACALYQLAAPEGSPALLSLAWHVTPLALYVCVPCRLLWSAGRHTVWGFPMLCQPSWHSLQRRL